MGNQTETSILEILTNLVAAATGIVDGLDREQWGEDEDAFVDAIGEAENALIAHKQIKTPNPDEVLMQDFVGIGFEGGVQTALAEIRSIYPQIGKLELNADFLRTKWAGEVAAAAEMLGFNRHYDGALEIGHGWAWRWVAFAYISYMKAIGAEHFVRQQLEINSSLQSGQRWITVEVYYQDYWRQHIKDRPVIDEIRARFQSIETAVNQALAKAKVTDGSWRSEPINWADLKCAAVEYVIDSEDGWYRATIEEAAPACPSLCAFVKKQIDAVGFGDVEVVTEW